MEDLFCTDQSSEEQPHIFFWIKNRNETYTSRADLKFDPSSDWHHYRIVINENNPNPYPVGEIYLLKYTQLDGKLAANHTANHIASHTKHQVKHELCL